MSADARSAAIAAVAATILVAGYVFSFVFAQATPEPHALPGRRCC